MRFEPHKNVAEILFEHVSVQTQRILKTQEAITKLKQTVIPHPPYGPNLLRQISPFWSAQRRERERKVWY
jgi:hypothetical protein